MYCWRTMVAAGPVQWPRLKNVHESMRQKTSGPSRGTDCSRLACGTRTAACDEFCLGASLLPAAARGGAGRVAGGVFTGVGWTRTIQGTVECEDLALRRHWLRAALSERWLPRESIGGPPFGPEDELGQSEANDGLRAALTRLSPRQQEVLHLVFYQDLTIEEAAGLLGISLGSARTHFERGKARLREQLRGCTVP